MRKADIEAYAKQVELTVREIVDRWAIETGKNPTRLLDIVIGVLERYPGCMAGFRGARLPGPRSIETSLADYKRNLRLLREDAPILGHRTTNTHRLALSHLRDGYSSPNRLSLTSDVVVHVPTFLEALRLDRIPAPSFLTDPSNTSSNQWPGPLMIGGYPVARNFTWFECDGEQYAFNRRQQKTLKRLYDDFTDGGNGLTHKTCGWRIDHVFRHGRKKKGEPQAMHPAWNRIVIATGDGRYTVPA